MRNLVLAALVAASMGVLAPVAAADQLDGTPLTIKADGLGALQFTNANRGGAGMLFPSTAATAHAGLEIVQGSVVHGLGGDRTPISGPTLIDPQHLQSVYKVGDDLQVTETFSYTSGSLTFDVDYSIKNLSALPVTFRPGELADVEAGGSDEGRGFIRGAPGSRMVGGWAPDGALVALQETTPWSQLQTGEFGQVFDDFETAGLTGGADPRLVDNGVGVAWPEATLDQNDSADFQVTWRGGADEEVNSEADATPDGCTTAVGGCTLREAIEGSGSGDIVTVPEGDYHESQLNGPMTVGHDLTVLGGGARTTTIHGQSTGQTFVVEDITADLRNLTITDGEGGDGSGGGIVAEIESLVTLSDVAVAGNHAWDGAGIFSRGRVELLRSTVSGNNADSRGAGLYVAGGSASLTDSTIAGNVAAVQGGGIYTTSNVDLDNATVSGNTATGGGGGIYQDFSGVARTLAQNSIVARNTGGSCAGTVVAIQSDAGLSDQASCFAAGANHVVANPLLGPLTDNGGETDTMLPQPSSAAVENGSSDAELCPPLDQRQLPRPTGSVCDVGAVELQTGFLTVITHVINDGGGHATADDFTTRIMRGAVQVGSDAGDQFGEFFDLPAGAYRVAASGPSGYTITYGSTCPGGNVAVPESDESVCTVTANDAGAAAPATLKVITKVVNDDGGTKAPGDFSVHVKRGAADVAGSPKAGSGAGTTYSLAAGSYTVAPSSSGVYTAALGGACSASGAVTLAAGAVKTCTITEDDKPPVPHKTLNATTSDGSVTIKLPGSDEFVTLGPGAQIPPGTVVDTRKGRVTLVAAADGKGGTATADFYEGLFKVGQTKGKKPITEVTLVEKLSCKGSGKAASAAKKKKRKRRLWGDGHGRFRTKGSFSSATVRGTNWLVQDTCTTTTTKVARGKVAVRDFVKKKTVLVKAGHKYVAKKQQP
jgi:predicted outer membrane repeat protein